ncbi:alkaline phosphatase family protein [Robiginitalea sp. SC105]|nr:alkaline phosphatase family protein [Robiginitalea sp. SC105]
MLLALLLTAGHLAAQVTIRERRGEQREEVFDQPPKLIVGIVVDQMRFDYLSRFWNHYGEDGFRRLAGDGFLCRNHHFNYAPTSTGPGHASVYTGATPAVHGIIGNNWYDKETGEDVYCAGDSQVQSVGTESGAGMNSPHRLLVTTITDELRLHHQMRSKVVAVSLKDRGAVLPGGFTANAAYWFEGGQDGNWISSSYYMEALPDWVRKFNASGAAGAYKRVWEPAEPLRTYVESNLDNVPYESPFAGQEAPVFPYDLPALWDGNGAFDLLRITPFGNSLTLDFALEALKEEELGADLITDFLAISFSSTDYVGHKFGVDSKEVQDTYIRLDRDLARLLDELDDRVGEGEYTVFLTSDHGAVPVPAYLADAGVRAGYPDNALIQKQFGEFLRYTYGTTEIIKASSNSQLFLDRDVIRNLELDPSEVEAQLAAELLGYEGIYQVYTGTQMRGASYKQGIPAILQNGFNQKRSGDVLIVYDPGFAQYSPTGSTHGTVHNYDTHVPLIFYGKGIPRGQLYRRTEIPDIAPTLAAMLGIAFPSGTTGEPIAEVLK